MQVKREQLGKYAVFTAKDCYAFGTDALLLARFCRLKQGDCVADICAGNGVVGFMAAESQPLKTLDFFELNPAHCRLIDLAVQENGVPSQVYQGDVVKLSATRGGKYDCVLCNPPYYKAAHQDAPQDETSLADYYRAAAKTECAITLEQVVQSANRLLRGNGRFYAVIKVERMAEFCALLEGKKLSVKRVHLVCAKKGDKPYLALVEAKKGTNSGILDLRVLTMGEDV